ncbi:MAG: hypothetical protein JXM73_25385 [Anaerolineae bacterium]|nr:hypothetical protein [Anaerolineae bacterium]
MSYTGKGERGTKVDMRGCNLPFVLMAGGVPILSRSALCLAAPLMPYWPPQ